MQLLLEGLRAVHLRSSETHLARLLKVQVQVVQTLLRRSCQQRFAADRLPLGKEKEGGRDGGVSTNKKNENITVHATYRRRKKFRSSVGVQTATVRTKVGKKYIRTTGHMTSTAVSVEVS